MRTSRKPLKRYLLYAARMTGLLALLLFVAQLVEMWLFHKPFDNIKFIGHTFAFPLAFIFLAMQLYYSDKREHANQTQSQQP